MKRFHLTLVLVCLSSAACAQGGPRVATTEAAGANQLAGYSSQGPVTANDVVRSANSCAPDQAAAVWGPGQSLMGYTCWTNPNGQ